MQLLEVQSDVHKLVKYVQPFKKSIFFLKKKSIFHPFNGIWFCIASPRFAGMGNLLKVLTREIENYPHFFLDFESKFQKSNDNDGNLLLS